MVARSLADLDFVFLRTTGLVDIKGKSAIHIARAYLGRKKNYVGQHFRARGYFASTVGRDEQVIRDYIRHHEAEDRRIDHLQLM